MDIKIDTTLSLDEILETENIAEELDKTDGGRILNYLDDAFTKDRSHCAERHERIEDYMRVFKCLLEPSNEYWRNQANVVWPVALDNCLEFYSTFVDVFPPSDLICGKVTVKTPSADQIDIMAKQRAGQQAAMMQQQAAQMRQYGIPPQQGQQQPPDPQQLTVQITQEIQEQLKERFTQIQQQADTAAEAANYQLENEMPEWRDDTNSLALIVYIQGLAMRKIAFDPCEMKPVHRLVLPTNIYFNEGARNVMSAERITEREIYSADKFDEYIQSGYFIEPESRKRLSDDMPRGDTLTDTFEVIEVTLRMDLDGDRRKEPYAVWFEKTHGDLLRIERLFEENDVRKGKNGTYIKAKHRYIDYRFLPDPQGSPFGMGGFDLLFHGTGTLSTLVNNLIDTARKETLGAGFYNANLHKRAQRLNVHPNEWLPVTGDPGQNLSNSFFPIPVASPSPVLFSIIQLLDEKLSGIASVDGFDISQMGANTAPTTAMIGADSGLKKFRSVFIGLNESLNREIGELHAQNARYNDGDAYEANTGKTVTAEDFRAQGFKLESVIDIDNLSKTQKMIRLQFLSSLKAAPISDGNEAINIVEVTKEEMRGFNIKDPDKFFSKVGQSQPDPLVVAQVKLAETQADLYGTQAALVKFDVQSRQEKNAADIEKTHAEATKSFAQAGDTVASGQIEKHKVVEALKDGAHNRQMDIVGAMDDREKHAETLHHGAVKHAVDTDAKHKQMFMQDVQHQRQSEAAQSAKENKGDKS